MNQLQTLILPVQIALYTYITDVDNFLQVAKFSDICFQFNSNSHYKLLSFNLSCRAFHHVITCANLTFSMWPAIKENI